MLVENVALYLHICDFLDIIGFYCHANSHFMNLRAIVFDWIINIVQANIPHYLTFILLTFTMA